MTRRYSELARIPDYRSRFDYLKLQGSVGRPTFGGERYLNQRFYRSAEWRRIREFVIARDSGLDLGCQGYEIYDQVIIHHMNPMSVDDLYHANEDILNPEFLITTTHTTHNAIHYGDETLLREPYVERRPGDTMLWQRR